MAEETPDRDPDELIGVKARPQPDAAAMALISGEPAPEAEPTDEALEAFAVAMNEEQFTQQAPADQMDAVRQQMQQMADLQRMQHQAMLAMREQLELERAERKKLEGELTEHQEKVNNAQVHYKMPGNLTEDEQWKLMVHDPAGLLG